jgi:DNA-binding NtrC family response regulator
VTKERGEAKAAVLVVDDDPAMRASLEGLLAFEFTVTAVGDIHEAQRRLAVQDFDVVLTDFDMPNGTGLELGRIVEEKFRHAMVILITGHRNHPKLQAVEKERSIIRVLEKPYDPERLLRWVRSTVPLARLRRASDSLARRPRPRA